MKDAQYRTWLDRGRTHQRQSMPLDALLCFRQAMRVEPTASDPRFHMGEVLWQLGRLPEALHAWAEAAQVDSTALAPRLALAEASLAAGEVEQADAAALQALALAPGEARARFVHAVAAMTHAEGGSGQYIGAAQDLASLLEAEPDLLRVHAFATALGDVLVAREPPLALAASLVHALDQEDRLRTTPAVLLAAIAQCGPPTLVGDAFWSAVATREYSPQDLEGVRRLAMAAHAPQRPEKDALVRAHAQLCTAVHAPRVPLGWPQRTAGALRIIVLAAPADADRLHGGLVAVAHEVAWVIALVADQTNAAAGDAERGGIRYVAVGTHPRETAAKFLAALDADAIVDTVGLAMDIGPLLAQRPARLVAALEGVAVPSGLSDRSFAELADVPPALASTISVSAGMPTPAAMGAGFADAVRLHQQGERDRALAAYDRVLALQPRHASSLYLRGSLQRDRGRDDLALADFVAALEAAPDYVDARAAAAKTALDTGHPERALDLAHGHLEPSAACAALWQTTGLAWLALGDAARAEEVLAHAAALDPNNADVHYNHALALQARHNAAEAARAFQRALTLRPDFIAAHFNLGVLFQRERNHGAAVAAYSQVLNADPRHVQAYKNMGEVLYAAGRLDAWRANFERFEVSCPDAFALAVQAFEVCQHFAQFDRIESYIDGLRKERFAAANATELVDVLEELLYLLLFFDVEPELIHRLSLTYDETLRSLYGEPLPLAAARGPGRVRVGYLSADLRDHVMGKMMWEVVSRHDRSRFEVFLYSTSAAEDAWTAKYRGLGDPFTVVAGDDDAAAAQRIRADDLDLLVDLSTHTRGARPGILARKPARVQITHVASAGTLGLSAMDFKLTDTFADVPGNQEHMIERLLPMQGCVYPYRHVEAAASDLYRRDALRIPPDAVVLGAFVTPMKLSRRCVRLWAEVLRQLPSALLAISPMRIELAAAYHHLFAAAGISRERIVLVPQGRNEAENQARYRVIDFVLDPMPFGGVNGTLEALDMEVPVVTLCGRRHGERTSYSILANLGVTDTVAASGSEYVAIAVRLARDPAFMRSVRERIHAGLRSSTLTDMAAHVRHLEAAYVEALDAKVPGVIAATQA